MTKKENIALSKSQEWQGVQNFVDQNKKKLFKTNGCWICFASLILLKQICFSIHPSTATPSFLLEKRPEKFATVWPNDPPTRKPSTSLPWRKAKDQVVKAKRACKVAFTAS